MYQRILAPVDGSPASMRGLEEAINLARVTKGTLRLVHVVNEYVFDPVYAPAVYYEPLLESMRSNGRKILAHAEDTVRQAGVEFESKLIETIGGGVAHLVLADAQAWRAELIVMGTHGRRGVGRVLLGSDAEMVLRSANCPVLLVRDKAA